MKYLIQYEKFILNDILDKISANGIDSLTDKEKHNLNNYSKGKPTDEVIYTDMIGPFSATLTLTTKTNDKWYGTIKIDDINDPSGINIYNGYIEIFDNGDMTAIFDNEDSDIYTDYEGLEHEIYNFIENAYFEI